MASGESIIIIKYTYIFRIGYGITRRPYRCPRISLTLRSAGRLTCSVKETHQAGEEGDGFGQVAVGRLFEVKEGVI